MRPFSALLYDTRHACGKISQLVSPPYDVISKEAESELKKHKHNIAHVILGIENGSYEAAAMRLHGWARSGVLKQDQKECFYIYEQSFNAEGRRYTRTALVSALRLEHPERGIVLPHENTLPKHIDDRAELLDATRTNAEPIFCIYDDPESVVDSEMEKAKRKPAFEFTDADTVVHRIFRISEKSSIAKIKKVLDDRRAVIADGHHRYESALRYSSLHPKDAGASHILAALVNVRNPGLVVLPTHRLFHGIEGKKLDAFEPSLEKNFVLPRFSSPKQMLRALGSSPPFTIAFWRSPDSCFLATASTGFIARELPNSNPLNSLDLTVLHEKILPPCLGLSLEEQAANRNIDYVKGTEDAIAKMRSGKYQLAAFVKPVAASEVLRIASSGLKMPQKSTYFYPKFWSGLVIRKFGQA